MISMSLKRIQLELNCNSKCWRDTCGYLCS